MSSITTERLDEIAAFQPLDFGITHTELVSMAAELRALRTQGEAGDLVRRLTVAADGIEKVDLERRSMRRGYEQILREAATALTHPKPVEVGVLNGARGIIDAWCVRYVDGMPPSTARDKLISDILALNTADEEETYNIGKRDGYEQATADIDRLTGGDGEYRFCTDHDPERHVPDTATMQAKIAERFSTLTDTAKGVEVTEAMVERAHRAQMSELFLRCQPDRGDVFAFMDDRKDVMRAALTASLSEVKPND